MQKLVNRRDGSVPRGRALLAAIATAAIALSSCRETAERKRDDDTPVFLISIDTLRSDRLPAYGYRSVATPHIDAFRSDSVLFEKAYSHCPLTLPSHATILTGRLPADVGLRDNVGYQLDPDVPTLPELLRRNGYRTGAAVSSFVLRKNTQIHRGFDFYDDDFGATGASTSIGEIQRDGSETVARSTKWLSGEVTSPPFFMLHLYEPHAPYAPPEPYRRRYTDRYDGEIAYADQLVGEFLAFLKSRNLYDRALIILLSDHGEGLGDHGEAEHGIFLYREAIQVPLIVKLPGGKSAGGTVSAPVQLIDVFPTVMEVSGMPAVKGAGTSLLSFISGGAGKPRLIYSETYYPRLHFGWSDLHSATDGTHHLIHAPRPELYDLGRDPAERTNVIEENRRIYASMRRDLEPLIRAAEAPAPIDAEEAAKLAALGYLGSGVTTAPGEILPDPKDKITTFDQIRRAFGLSRRHEISEALEVTNALLTENGRMVDLWDLKARLLGVQGNHRGAIEAARAGLRLSPNATHLALLVGTLSLEIGELDQAQQHAELAVRAEPARAHDLLARVWIARGDLDRAEKEARASLATERDRALALITLARVEKERDRHEESLRHLDAAAAVLRDSSRTINGLHFLRGDVLARLGRTDEAASAFMEEIRLFPEEPRPYKHLVLLYVAEGRIDEATKLIHQLVNASPTPLAYLAVIDVLDTVGDERGVRFWSHRAQQRFPSDRRFARQ
jgi:arylsulfatase A-like enzyme/Flp pilus assembly protein TadD